MEFTKTNLSFKYQLAPTKEQESIFESWAGACRFIYNLALEQRILWWNQYRKSVNYYDQANELKNLKTVEGFEWIKFAPAQCLQQTLKDLDKAFKSFFNSKFGFPKFKKRGRGDSFRLPEPKHFKIFRVNKNIGMISLPKIGAVKLHYSRDIIGIIKNATIKKEGEKWFVSFSCEQQINIPINHNPELGIDRGISDSLKTSNGTTYSLPASCCESRDRIKILQRRLKNKKKFSKNWTKTQRQIGKLHSKISNTRKDFLHKTSTELAKSHGLIRLEDLKINNMSKSAKGTIGAPGKNVAAKSGLNREILFQGWGMFETFLSYKLERVGGVLELVSPKYTSQRCSQCLYVDSKNRRNKVFKCLNCGFSEDADLNAAININRAGHARSDCGGVVVRQSVEAVTSSELVLTH